jgi:FG-GAP repeat
MRIHWKLWLLGMGAGALLVPASLASGQTVRADFDRDGFEDLAIGVPNEKIANEAAAGAVNVIYGSATGLNNARNQLWSQDGAAVEEIPKVNDHFGAALAAGDFNGDGFADLAIGVPGEDVGTNKDCGGVNVIYGTASGLSASGLGDQFWNQGSLGLKGNRQDFDSFGAALAAGDFNADGFDDLAVGVPLEDSALFDQIPGNDRNNSGCVNVIYGSPRGLDVTTIVGDQKNDQLLFNSLGLFVDNENFGAALAVMDINHDGRDDLAVGAPGDFVRTNGINFATAGSVTFYRGTEDGLKLPTKVKGPDVAGARFGLAIAGGDFNGDSFKDVAIGAPFDRIANLPTGTVKVFQSFAVNPALILDQNAPGAPSNAQSGDEFGASLASGDFNADGFDDLCVGVPGEIVSGINAAGAVNIFRGTTNGLLTTTGVEFHQDSSQVLGSFNRAMPDVVEANDQFGRAVFAGDFNNDGADDLVIGVANENSGRGIVHVMHGSSSLGISLLNFNTTLTQDSANILGASEIGDNFGASFVNSPKFGPLNAGYSGVWTRTRIVLNKSEKNRTNSRVTGTLVVFNPGGTVAKNGVINIYLSKDAKLTSSDRLLASVNNFGDLGPGASRELKVDEKLVDMNATNHFLIAEIDATDVVVEINEDNNIVVSNPLVSSLEEEIRRLQQRLKKLLELLNN